MSNYEDDEFSGKCPTCGQAFMMAKYAAVCQELESAQNDIDLRDKEIAALRTHAKNHALEYISLAGQMQTYLEALPKIKADAIREAIIAVIDPIKWGYDGDCGVERGLDNYADKLEAES